MPRITGLLIAALLIATSASAASATQVEKHWICHGTGSATNPYVLIDVPTNSAHFTKHLPDGDDLAVADQGDPSCPGAPDEPPVTEPFAGTLTFALDGARCAAGEVGVPGFTVTQETVRWGEVVDEQVVFAYPATCVPASPGSPGPAGANGANGAPGATTVAPARTCVSHRRFSLFLPVRALRHAKSVRVTVAGVMKIMHPNRAGRVRIDLTGLRAGVYGVVVQTPRGVRGVDPKTGLTRAGYYARIYTVCGAGNVSKVNVP
jgi:hypothetical protein